MLLPEDPEARALRLSEHTLKDLPTDTLPVDIEPFRPPRDGAAEAATKGSLTKVDLPGARRP